MKKYSVVSLFTGMGGMDLGFGGAVVVRRESVNTPHVEWIQDEHAIDGFVRLRPTPFQIVFQNDILPIANRILEWNGWKCSSHSSTDIRDLLTSNDSLIPSSADVVIGGFPCQDFSHAGKRRGFSSERGKLYHAFVQVVRRCRPLVFVAENVYGLLTMDGVVDQIAQDFSSCGYIVDFQLVKCEEHGIPQTRWRTIIIGVREDRGRPLVSASPHTWHVLNENRQACTIAPYFRHLQEPDESMDDGQRVYSKAAWLPRGQGQKEIVLESFAPTIRAEHHGNIEFRRLEHGVNKSEASLSQRRLTVREVALLQTFPPDCILTDPSGRRPTCRAYQPIGNAVPPLLSYLLARKVESLLHHMT